MGVSTRGKLKNVITAVPLTETLFYAWSATDLTDIQGVDGGDLTALGHLSGGSFPSGANAQVLYSPQRPTAGRFTKIVNRTPTAGQQKTCNTFGDASTQAAKNRAAAAGWRCAKGIILPTRTNNGKSITVAARLPNGVYYLQTVPKSQADEYGAVLGLETSLSYEDLQNSVRGCQRPHCAIAVKELSNGSITMPCSYNKMDDANAAGWNVTAPVI